MSAPPVLRAAAACMRAQGTPSHDCQPDLKGEGRAGRGRQLAPSLPGHQRALHSCTGMSGGKRHACQGSRAHVTCSALHQTTHGAANAQIPADQPALPHRVLLLLQHQQHRGVHPVLHLRRRHRRQPADRRERQPAHAGPPDLHQRDWVRMPCRGRGLHAWPQPLRPVIFTISR